MTLFALAMAPGNFVAWLVVGLIAGALAGMVMKGGGFGILGDIVVGLIGAMVGGFLMSFFDNGVTGFWGTVFVSFIGACVLIAIARAMSPRRTI